MTTTTPAAPVAIDPNTVYTAETLAPLLDLAPRTIKESDIPVADLGHRTKRYVGSEVLAWLKRQTVR